MLGTNVKFRLWKHPPLWFLSVKDPHRDLLLNRSQSHACTHTKVTRFQLSDLRTDLSSHGNVVQSDGTASAPADLRFPAENGRRSHKQLTEGDVYFTTGVCDPADPTRGLEDPPWIWKVSKWILHFALCVTVLHEKSAGCTEKAEWLLDVHSEVYHLLWVNRTANLCPMDSLIRVIAQRLFPHITRI